jgi:hypothetical protein
MVALDDLALQCARDLAASQPRCDYTIAQLPALSPPAALDLVPVYHNATGQTCAVTAQSLVDAINPPALQFSSISQSASITNSTTLTPFSAPLATLPIAALNVLGAILRLRWQVFITETASPTLLLNASIGGTVVYSTGPVTVGTTAILLTQQLDLHTTLIGATGTLLPAFAYSSMIAQPQPNQAAIPNLNLTGALPLTFGAQWGTASLNNTAIMNGLSVEVLYPVLTG